jgi:probable rRNA maturation factor
MKDIRIFFFKEEIKFRLIKQKELKQWILKNIQSNKKTLSNLNFIFCSDKYLRSINKKHLGHNYFTDIVTFDNSEMSGIISGDIYISIDRLKANALSFNNSFEDELHRVMAHGVLHLIGYGDKTNSQRKEMKFQEDLWLEKRKF